MKRSILLFVLVVAALIATACGTSAPVATEAPVQPAVTEAPAQPAGTEAVVSSGGATTVEITLDDNTISSSLDTFQVGVPYTFVITNVGRHGHNFNISTPVSIVGSLQDALKTALLAVDQDQLGAGASVTVEFTFPASAAGAQLEFSCLIRRHYEDGMWLPITVTN